MFCFVLSSKIYYNNLQDAIEAKSEAKSNIAEDIKKVDNDDSEEVESASIQVVHKDVVHKVGDVPLKDDNLSEEDHVREVPEDTNTTKGSLKYNNFYEDLLSDSVISIGTSPEDKIEELLIPSGTSIDENKDYSNRKEEIAIVFEQITKSSDQNENSGEDVSVLNEDENNWRSAEKIHSDIKEYSDEEISFEDEDRDFNVDYMDKKMGMNNKRRMEVRKPGRREQDTRPMDIRQYGPPDDHFLGNNRAIEIVL